MHFAFPQKILFKHCDPAGIVFYPRFAEILNDAVEALFADRLGWPFETIHPRNAVPTAALDFRFRRPCRHGDRLELQITIGRLGRSSLALSTRAMRADELCFESDQVLVCVGPEGRSVPWPDPVRDRIRDMMEAT